MKKRMAVCCFCLFLAGCFASTARTEPTLKEALEKANIVHQSVEKQEVDTSPYMREFIGEEKYNEYFETTNERYAPDQELTLEQATEDVVYLFEALRNCYGPYNYFGGARAFDEAENAILVEVAEKDELTCDDLQNILLNNLTFIKDGHFNVNYKYTNPVQVPFFFREVEFIKTENGYQTANGKEVKEVEGCPDLEALFKLSISQEGELVYYPVLLKELAFENELNNSQICDENLVVHCTNGETFELTAEPYQIYSPESVEGEENSNVSLKNEDDIPLLQINSFTSKYKTEIIESANSLKDAPIAILDLRLNSGGAADLAYNWMKQYAGTRVPRNQVILNVFTGLLMYDSADRWIDRENVLIILTGKYTASASESLIDMAYNLENVLVVGENTGGALLGSSKKICLLNSKIVVDIGGGNISLKPEGNEYFKEGRGFYPDIWVPANEAENLILKLIQKN